MTARSIFLTNNGLADHIGVAQVLPYLEGLAKRGHSIECISVETPNQDEVYESDVRSRLQAAGITHHTIRRSENHHFRSFERFLISRRMYSLLVKRIDTFQPDLLHCRSYMPLGATLKASAVKNIPFIFDMRGFWIDQRVESGIWNTKNPIFKAVIRHFRRQEAEAFSKAAGVVVLTEDAKSAVTQREDYNADNLIVAPCSVDQSHFNFRNGARGKIRTELGFLPTDIVLAYLGSTGPLYPIDLVYRLFSQLREYGYSPKLLMLGNHDVKHQIQNAMKAGCVLKAEDIKAKLLRHEQVPEYLSAADVGLAPLLQTFSSLGVSATKIGEYLSCGLPVICNSGVGDIHSIIEQGRTGWVLEDFSNEQIKRAAQQITSGRFLPPQEISRKAAEVFNIVHAVDRYDELYHSIIAEPDVN